MLTVFCILNKEKVRGIERCSWNNR